MADWPIVIMTADCGHLLQPGPACEEEPNPPMAWCGVCQDWAFFTGAQYTTASAGLTLGIQVSPREEPPSE